MRKILLTGGTGLIGKALLPALKKAGYQPLVLTRQKSHLPDAILWNGRDIPPTLSGEGIVAAINLVGASIAGQRWTESYKRELWESRVEPTRNLAQWLRKNAPQARLLSASAVGYYGATLSQERLTESSPPGRDFLAGLAQAWEAAAQQAPQPPVIFRLGVVLSQEGGAWVQLRRAFRLGIGTYFAPGHQGFSWVHIADVVRAFMWALEQSDKAGIYNLTAPHPLSAKELSKAILRCRGGFLLLPLPESLMKVLLGELALTLIRGAYVLPQRLLAEGFTFIYPTIDEALKELLP
ncbi:MAG: TIGR01777 family oxidoreductase [Bacteroidia bacterium]|nr:TIGR01777 family oxidoreductase [Bacteroidia bacterium]MDW8057711.1 TIGR01777 family oxidoreductase [Bacteroidia bacterium]